MTEIPNARALLTKLDHILDVVPAGCTADARVLVSRTATMRYANSAIHQPHLQVGRSVSVRVEREKRLGTATTSDLSDRGIAAVVEEAARLARVAPVERRFLGFSGLPGGPARPTAFSPGTAGLSPEGVARIARDALAAAQDEVPKGRISGAIHVGGTALAVGNSSGVRRTNRRSYVSGTVLVDRPDLDPPPSGWSEVSHWSTEGFDGARLGREAAQRVARGPIASAAPGTYPVVLRGPAASELLGFFGYLGFGGHGEEEGWSCLRGKRSRRLFPRWLELHDDGRSSQSIPTAVDFEGAPKRRTLLVDDGRAGPAVTDLVTAGRLRTRPTGHALPPEAPWGEWGPVPENIVMPAGGASEEELLKEIGDGLLVTRFHYVRVVHPGRGEITGMTRDGTYRVEGGEVVAPVRNLRFTDSVVGALQRLQAAGKEVRCHVSDESGSSVSCPGLAVSGFRFTSTTIF